MQLTQFTLNRAGRVLVAFTLSCLMAGPVISQTIKNGGTMNNTGALSCTTFQNWKNTTAGTLNNSTASGVVTVSGTAAKSFDNDFSGSVVSNTSSGVIDLTNNSSTYANGVGSSTNSATIKLAGAITNSSGTVTTSSGTFEYKGTAAQTVLSTVASNTYANLTITGASTKTLGGSISVGTLVTINTTATLAVGSGNTLTLNGSAPFTLNGSGALDATTGASAPTVVYNAGGAQDVLGTSYINLTLQNGNIKTAGGNVVMTGTGTLTAASSTTFDLGSNSLTTAATTTITNNDTIRTAGSVTFGASHSIAGTFAYYGGSGSQTVGGAAYTNLSLRGASSKTLSNDLSVSGTYSAAGGTRTYSNTFTYNNSTAQSVIGGESYNNLTISGASDTVVSKYKTASATLTVGGALTVSANNTLDMQGFSSSTFGSGTNSGKIRWSASNVYVAGAGMTEFYGSSSTTVAAGSSYGNLLFTGTGTQTIAGSVTATGGNATAGVTVVNNLTVSGTLTVTSMDLNNDGTITNSGTISVN